VNNFSKSWKLVFVAAIALILAGVAPEWSVTVIAQPLRAASSQGARFSFSPDLFVGRAALPQNGDQERRLSPGPIIGLICAIAASSVALGVAFGLRRRMDRIAGPDTEKADED
jgi:hypothetical protein